MPSAFAARLRAADVDPPMLLFALRRLGVKAAIPPVTQGAKDIEVTGTVEDVEGLIAALTQAQGALHVDDRHIALKGGTIHEATDAVAAEAHLGGPFTVQGFPRAAWAHGGPVLDHIVQVLYFSEEHLPLPDVAKATGQNIEAVASALKRLVGNQVVRKFRHDDAWGEAYGLASTTRTRIDAMRSS